MVLVTCSYKEQEFCRVGYYVNNEYGEPYDEEQGVPTPLDIKKVTRQILADKVSEGRGRRAAGGKEMRAAIVTTGTWPTLASYTKCLCRI